MERVKISKRLVLINSVSSLVTRLLSISVLVWLQQYLLKRITPEEYSLLPVLYSVMMFAPLLTTILTGGLGRYIVEAYAKEDDERITQIVSTMFPILCAAGLVFLAAGWTFSWHIGSVLNIAPERLWDARIMMALLMFSAAVRLPLSPFGVGLFVRQKFVLQNVIGVGTEIFRLALLFTLLFGVSTRVMWVVTASVTAELLNLAVTQAISRRLVPSLRFSISHRHWSIAREITSFGGWSFVQSLANTVRMALDPIILNGFGTPVDIVCFYIGTLFCRHIEGIGNALRGPLQPSLTAIHARGEIDRIQRVYIRGGRINLWFSLFLAVPFMVYAHEFVTLYVGSVYEQAAPVMRLSLLMFPIAYGNTMFVYICEAKANNRLFAIRFLVMNVINLILTLIFVIGFRFGAIGSALATACSFAVVYPLSMWPTGRRLVGVDGATWFRRTIVPGLLPGIASGLVMVSLKLFVTPETWFSLLTCATAGAATYLVVLLRSCLGEDDKADILRVVHSLPFGEPIAASCIRRLLGPRGDRLQ